MVAVTDDNAGLMVADTDDNAGAMVAVTEDAAGSMISLILDELAKPALASADAYAASGEIVRVAPITEEEAPRMFSELVKLALASVREYVDNEALVPRMFSHCEATAA